MKMKVYFNLFFIIATITCQAQFDTNKKVLNIAPVTNNAGQVSSTSSSSIKYPSIFDKKDKLLESVSLLKKKDEEQKSVMEKESFADPAVEYKKTFDKLNDKVFVEDYVAIKYGSYKSKTKKIKILCRDYDDVDGDQVRVLLNDIQIFTCTLNSDYNVFYVELTQNYNIIDFQAINTGSSPPNTAKFTILDDNDELIYDNNWSLFEGLRARIIIVK